MTRDEAIHLAETAEERVKGYVRESARDPQIKAALRRRYVPLMKDEPANDGASVPGYRPVYDATRKRTG